MKLPCKLRIPNLTDQQKDLLLGLAIVLSVATIYYFQWAFYLTSLEGSKVNIDQPERYFWWANDSRGYRAAGEWLFGREDNHAIGVRPWLYPFMLGLARTLFGERAEAVLWVAQFLMWLGSGSFIYLALKNGIKSTPVSITGSGIFFSHPSPLILTFHGMTESLNVLLIAILCWVLTTNKETRLHLALLLLGLATVLKPVYLPHTILLAFYVITRNSQAPKLKRVGIIALILTPLWIQLLLSFLATGKPTISGIGSYTFKNYLVADVYMDIEGLKWRETTELIEDWNLREQLTYLWDHQRATVIAFRRHIIDDNLWTGSFFTLGEGNRMAGFALTHNAVSAYIHLLMSPLMIYYLVSARFKGHKETLALLYIGFVIQILITGASTGQEDRLIITALPLWIVAYLVAFSAFHKNSSN